MSNLPKEIQEQLRKFVSEASDGAIDFVINLSGKYIDREKREKLKKDAELEISPQIEEVIAKVYQLERELRKKSQKKKLEACSLKERFYLVTDTFFGPLGINVPKNTHAMDYLFQICEELRNARFNFRYLKDTNYAMYLQSLKKLMHKLEKEHKINESWEALKDFKNSKDFHPLLQLSFQRIIKHYEFLEQDFSKIEKKQLDKYLEIYEELSGIYEKFVSLIVALIYLLQTNDDQKYQDARKRALSENIADVEKKGWKIFVSGFNKNVRNAIVHKTCKIDILKETVDFIDRDKTSVLTFREVQKETRELSALVLIMPHIFISVFCMASLSIKETLNNLPNKKGENSKR
jgi:hypothetical protein